MAGKVIDPLLTAEQVAEILGVKVATVRQWRYLGIGPDAVVISSKCVRYRRSAVDAYIDAHTVKSEASPAA